MTDWLNRTHIGDVQEVLRRMVHDGVKVQTVVTSPPYWGLRDYGVEGQHGLEATLEEHIHTMAETFDLVRKVLKPDGTLWMNYGDSWYSPRACGGIGANSKINGQRGQEEFRKASHNRKSREQPQDLNGPNRRAGATRLKEKDLVGAPWRVAFALQEAGWYFRSPIVWHKPNPMPESVVDRPTKAHEYIFLMSKRKRYYYDLMALAEKSSAETHARAARARSGSHKWADGPSAGRFPGPIVGVAPGQPKSRPQGPAGIGPKTIRDIKRVSGWAEGAGSHDTKDHARAEDGLKDSTKFGRGAGWRNRQNESFQSSILEVLPVRNARSVWSFDEESSFTDWFCDQPGSAAWWFEYQAQRNEAAGNTDVWRMPTEAYPGAHFATFPTTLARRCIAAGSRPGDTVLDPFMGSGTTGMVAQLLGRNFIGIDLNPNSLKHAADRTEGMTLGFGLAHEAP